MDISKPTHPLNLENLIEPFPKWIFGTFMFFLFYHFQNNTFHQYIELCNTESIDFINIFLVVNFSFSVNLIYFALSFRFHKRINHVIFIPIYWILFSYSVHFECHWWCQFQSPNLFKIFVCSCPLFIFEFFQQQN